MAIPFVDTDLTHVKINELRQIIVFDGFLSLLKNFLFLNFDYFFKKPKSLKWRDDA